VRQNEDIREIKDGDAVLVETSLCVGVDAKRSMGFDEFWDIDEAAMFGFDFLSRNDDLLVKLEGSGNNPNLETGKWSNKELCFSLRKWLLLAAFWLELINNDGRSKTPNNKELRS